MCLRATLRSALACSLLALAACQSRTFLYTGADQTFVVPPGVTMVNVKLWGAGGGGGIADRAAADSSGGGGVRVPSLVALLATASTPWVPLTA